MAGDDDQRSANKSRHRSMRVWCFHGAGEVGALSNDAGGVCLPPDLGPWIATHVIDLVPVRADERMAMTLIERHGYCCFKRPPSA